MFAGSGQGICQQRHLHSQGKNIVQLQKPLGSQSKTWEKWATGHELVGIAVLATLEAVRGEQPFRGSGPDKKIHEAGGTETCHHVNTHLPPKTHAHAQTKLQHCYGNFLTKDIAAATLTFLPMCSSRPLLSSPPPPNKPRALPLLLLSCLDHGSPSVACRNWRGFCWPDLAQGPLSLSLTDPVSTFLSDWLLALSS